MAIGWRAASWRRGGRPAPHQADGDQFVRDLVALGFNQLDQPLDGSRLVTSMH
jgi:hypothetical protein